MHLGTSPFHLYCGHMKFILWLGDGSEESTGKIGTFSRSGCKMIYGMLFWDLPISSVECFLGVVSD